MADFSWTPEFPAEGDQVQFTERCSGNPSFWRWTFEPDTRTSEDPYPVQSFPIGNHDVRLEITDETGGTSIIARELVIRDIVIPVSVEEIPVQKESDTRSSGRGRPDIPYLVHDVPGGFPRDHRSPRDRLDKVGSVLAGMQRRGESGIVTTVLGNRMGGLEVEKGRVIGSYHRGSELRMGARAAVAIWTDGYEANSEVFVQDGSEPWFGEDFPFASVPVTGELFDQLNGKDADDLRQSVEELSNTIMVHSRTIDRAWTIFEDNLPANGDALVISCSAEERLPEFEHPVIADSVQYFHLTSANVPELWSIKEKMDKFLVQSSGSVLFLDGVEFMISLWGLEGVRALMDGLVVLTKVMGSTLVVWIHSIKPEEFSFLFDEVYRESRESRKS